MPEKKNYPLQKMFSSIPGRYDLLNRLLTFRMDEVWRNMTARAIVANEPDRFIDICCGTGDLAANVAKLTGEKCDITCMDFSEPMLLKAREKINNINNDASYVLGNAGKMSFEDNFFDAAGISFAFRNVTWRNSHREQILQEMRRVLKKGGKLFIIETSRPESVILKFLFRLYLDIAVGFIGGLISGNRKAYKYLAHSAKNYYSTDEITVFLKDAGFNRVTHKPLLKGIAALTIAEK